MQEVVGSNPVGSIFVYLEINNMLQSAVFTVFLI